MKFETQEFLDTYGIEYADHGPNCAKGHVVINCILCQDDPSKHLGINMETGAWSCWRDSSHRGNTPIPLIKYLLGCSWAEAKTVANQFSGYEPPSLERKTEKSEDDVQTTLSLPPEIVSLAKLSKLPSFLTIFSTYLENSRGILLEEAEAFNLHFGIFGKWSHRVIFLYYENSKLVGWSGRGIWENAPNKPPKYCALTPTEGALRKTTETLWGMDYALQEGEKKRLFVVEGPFDALKLNVLFLRLGMGENRAVCLSTATLSKRQVGLITKIAKLYDFCYLMLDAGFELKALSLFSSRLSHIPNMQPLPMLPGYKDSGEFTEKAVEELLNNL